MEYKNEELNNVILIKKNRLLIASNKRKYNKNYIGIP